MRFFRRRWKWSPGTCAQQKANGKPTKECPKPHNKLALSLQRWEANLVIFRICDRIRRERPECWIATIHDAVVCLERDVPFVVGTTDTGTQGARHHARPGKTRRQADVIIGRQQTMSKKKKQEWDPCPNCGDKKLHDMGKGTFDGHDNLLMCHSCGHTFPEPEMRKTPPTVMPFGKHKDKSLEIVLAEEPGYLCWFYDAVDGNEELKQAIAALPEFPARLAKYRERKGLKDKTLEQRIEEVVARMFAVEPTPQETDDLCDRLFNGQDSHAPPVCRPRYGRRQPARQNARQLSRVSRPSPSGSAERRHPVAPLAQRDRQKRPLDEMSHFGNFVTYT